LLNIISGTEEITMSEIGEIIDYLQDEAGQDATIIWGNGTDAKLGNQISVTIIATGFDINPNRLFQAPVEMVELQAAETAFEINLEDELPFEMAETSGNISKPAAMPQPVPAKSRRKHKKDKSELVSEANGENGNVDSWFFRQFTKLLGDAKDTSLADDTTENNL
jgi:cell division protein FtsZ